MFIVSVPAGEWKEVRYRKAIDKRKLNQDTNGQNGKKYIVQFILLDEQDAYTKQ